MVSSEAFSAQIFSCFFLFPDSFLFEQFTRFLPHGWDCPMTSSDNTHIRDFTEADIGCLARLIHDTIDTSYQLIYPQQAINFFKGFHTVEKIRTRAEKGNTIVIERNGEVIGTGSVIDGEILGVFIKPAFQKQGYGKVLMQELERIATTKNCPKVTLSVSLPSRKFYERLGYSNFKECAIEVKNGKLLDYWKASKSLRETHGFQK